MNVSGYWSQSKSRSRSASESFVDPSQAPFLNFLRNMAFNQAQGYQGQQDYLQGVSQNLLGQGMAAYGQTMNQLGNVGSPQVQQAQMDALAGNLGQMFQQQVLPGIRRGAGLAGMQGGGRQGVAEGVAAGNLGQAFISGATDIMAEAQRQRLAAAQTGMAGIGQLGGMMGIAGAPFEAGYNPLMQFASILGAPTVLSESWSKSNARSYSTGGSFGIGGS